jgi:hypothetical protein
MDADVKNKCGRELKAISKQLEPEDRKKAMAEFNISYVTVSRYSSGKVANAVLGINLLNFFKKRVRRRNNKMSQLLRY